MQVLLGVLSPDGSGEAAFANLAAGMAIDQPEIIARPGTGGSVVLGAAARRFATWQDVDGERSVHLDGEILEIDGRPTSDGRGAAGELETVSRLFETHGSAAWSRLDGSFLLIVRHGATIYAGTDVAGTRGVYWWEEGGTLAFHSRLLDLVPSYPAEIREDWGAVANYLATGLYPPGRTAISGIRHLGAGQHVEMRPSGATEGRHFRLAFTEHGPARRTELVDELIANVEAAVATRWRAAVEPVVPLSGGLDSRYLAAEIVRQAGKSPVRTMTWGEAPDRANSDAQVAPTVAEALGAEHAWRDKVQVHTQESFERSIYVSSGECDYAIHYPGDDQFYRRLHDELGFSSLFRGDECFGYERLITNRAVAVLGGVGRVSQTGAYAGLLTPELLALLAPASEAVMDEAMAGLASRTPTGKRDELWYAFGIRRLLAPYNAVRHQDLEVYTPFLDRRLLEWLRRVPEALRAEKRLVRDALSRRFPDVASIPYATRDNLPAWQRRWREDPILSGFLREWCSAPGWLDTVGIRPAVLDRIERLHVAGPITADPAWRRDLRRLLNRSAPSRILLELGLERRAERNALPEYLQLLRLAVLHGLLGSARRRQSERLVAVQVPMTRSSGSGTTN